MAKKLRFPLIMDNGVEVRTPEELKNNFSPLKIMEYKENGKLVTWLRDRNEGILAEKIDSIGDEGNVLKKICEILDIPCTGEMYSEVEKALEKNKNLERLREYADGEKYLDKTDIIAFNQQGLYDLLNKGIKTIYLFGDSFSVPLGAKGVSYIGINNPIVVIKSEKPVNFCKKNISFTNISFDEKYQAMIDRYYASHYRNVVKNAQAVKIGDYLETGLLTPQDRSKSQDFYNMAKPLVEELSPEKLFNRNSGKKNKLDKNNKISALGSFVDNVNCEFYNSNIYLYSKHNTGYDLLTRIYDYDKANEYAKTIIDEAFVLYYRLWMVYNALGMTDDRSKMTYNFGKLPDYKIFIFWALMILTVDKTDAEKYLSEICDLANVLILKKNEFAFLLKCVNASYGKYNSSDRLTYFGKSFPLIYKADSDSSDD